MPEHVLKEKWAEEKLRGRLSLIQKMGVRIVATTLKKSKFSGYLQKLFAKWGDYRSLYLKK